MPPITEYRNSIRRGVAWAGLGNFIYFGCQYGMLIAVAKFGDPAAVGRFALAQAITAPIIIFSQMQLRQLQVTDPHGDEFSEYLLHRLVFTVAAVVIISAVALFYSGSTGWVIGIVGLAKAFESLSDVAYGRLQRHERLDLVAISLMLKGLLSLAVMGVVMLVTRDLVAAVLGLMIVWAALLVLFDLPAQRWVGSPSPRTRGHVVSLRHLTKIALPLAWTSVLISISSNIPRYVLDALYGKEAVGIFAIAATPLLMTNMVAGAVMQAALPRAARYFQTGELAAFHRLSLRIAAISVGISLLAVLVFATVGDALITFLFTDEYLKAVPLMIVLSLGTALGGVGAYGAVVLSAARRFSLQFYNVLVMTAVQAAVCFLLIRSYALIGAGWAELIRYSTSALFLLIAGSVVMHRRRAVLMGT